MKKKMLSDFYFIFCSECIVAYQVFATCRQMWVFKQWANTKARSCLENASLEFIIS